MSLQAIRNTGTPPRRRTANQPKFQRSTNASGFRGVYPHGSEWRALILINGRLLHLGTYPPKEQAAEAEKFERAKAAALRRIQDLATSLSLPHGDGGKQ